jgi:DNA-binding NarL/FixJ family response regulator
MSKSWIEHLKTIYGDNKQKMYDVFYEYINRPEIAKIYYRTKDKRTYAIREFFVKGRKIKDVANELGLTRARVDSYIYYFYRIVNNHRSF